MPQIAASSLLVKEGFFLIVSRINSLVFLKVSIVVSGVVSGVVSVVVSVVVSGVVSGVVFWVAFWVVPSFLKSHSSPCKLQHHLHPVRVINLTNLRLRPVVLFPSLGDGISPTAGLFHLVLQKPDFLVEIGVNVLSLIEYVIFIFSL